MATKKKPRQEPRAPVKLQFHYIKTPDYKEIPCHGALGSVTPNKQICMSLFSERGPIPRVVEYDIHGSPGQEIAFSEGDYKPSHIETRTGIIRNVHFSAYLGLDTARQLQQWLVDQIKALEAAK
jgi:hypothetical protein